MKDFYDREKYTEDDINRIIEKKWEESLNLEFKSSEALANTAHNKKEISKDISSFANSAGGMLIYGIREENYAADSISYIDGNIVTKEWIEHVINSNIYRKIEGILIIPIRFDSDIGKTVYIVKIPESNQAPHMASDNKYYRRYNFESVPMDEYEVRDKYYRLGKTELSIVDVRAAKGSHAGVKGNYGYMDLKIDFLVKNVGNSIEDRYQMEIEIPSILIYDPGSALERYPHISKGENRVYTIPNDSPLFPGRETSLCPIPIKINKKTFRDPENFRITIGLDFSNGSKNYEYDLRDVLVVDGETINEKVFAKER